MTAKEYLSQAKYLDTRINMKILQLDELNSLATKATAVITGMPHSPNNGQSRMEDTVVKIIALQEEINNDIDRLIDLKDEMHAMIESLPSEDYRSVIDMRYCEHMPWAEISSSLRISLPYVYKLHDRALAEIEKKMHRV